MKQSKITVDAAFDQLFAERAPPPTFEDRLVAAERELRDRLLDSATHPVTYFYAENLWETGVHSRSEAFEHEVLLWLPAHLRTASTSTAFASVMASLFTEIRHFLIHNKPMTFRQFKTYLRLLPKLLEKGLKHLVADLGVTVLGVGMRHVLETLVASYAASWTGIVKSLRRSGLSLARAIYALLCADGSIRVRAHVALIELAAALSSAVSASLQVVLDTLPFAPMIAAFAGHSHWFNAVIAGALFAAMVAALHVTDVAGVIRERRRVLINAEAERALAAAENSALVAGAAIERSRSFYEALGIHY